jgi:P-type Ca2+ transporter type 2C
VASSSMSDSYRRRSASDVTALSMASNYEERDHRPLSYIPNESGSFGISPDSLDAIFEERNFKDICSLGGLPGLAFALRSDCSSGIKLDESYTLDRRSQRSGPDPHSDRVETFGCNRLPEKKVKTLLQLMWAALQDRVLILLTVVATVSLILGLYQTFGQPHLPGQPRVEWVEGTTIMAAVVIVVVVSGLNDYQKERQFARLNAKVGFIIHCALVEEEV